MVFAFLLGSHLLIESQRLFLCFQALKNVCKPLRFLWPDASDWLFWRHTGWQGFLLQVRQDHTLLELGLHPGLSIVELCRTNLQGSHMPQPHDPVCLHLSSITAWTLWLLKIQPLVLRSYRQLSLPSILVNTCLSSQDFSGICHQ